MRRSRVVLQSFLPLIAALSLLSCVRRYEEPRLAEPHALVKFRFLHHTMLPGSQLSEILRLDGYDIAIPEGIPTTPRLRSVRVRPVLTGYRFVTEYFHTYTTTRTEYRTETYSCGYGANARTCTRTVPRTVTDTHHVTDAACERRIAHEPLAGAVYLVQYDFYGPDACSVSCFRQLDGAGGEFQLVPCGPDEPPVGTTSGGSVPPSSYGAAPASAPAPVVVQDLTSVPPPEPPPPAAEPRPTEATPSSESGGSELAPPR